MTARLSFKRARSIVAVVLVYVVGAAAAAGGGLAMAPLVALAALSIVPFHFSRPQLRIGLPALTAAALAAWLAVSLAWTPTPKADLRYAQALATVLAGALVTAGLMRARGDRLVRRIALGGVALLALFLIIDVGFGFPISRIGREADETWIIARSASKGVAVLGLLAWGAALACGHQSWRSTAIAGTIAVLVGGLGVAVDMSAAVVAAALGFACWCVASVWPSKALQGVGIILGVVILSAPFLALALNSWSAADNLPYSWTQRLEIWRSAAAHVFESPLFGHGFDSSRSFASEATVNGVDVAAIPLHPHNLVLQLWLEGGGVAAFLAAAFVTAATWRIAVTCAPSTSRAATSLLSTWCVFSMLSFGAWQEWWIASLGASTALVALFTPRIPLSDAINT